MSRRIALEASRQRSAPAGQLGSDPSAIGAAYTAIFGNSSAAVLLEKPSTSYGKPGSPGDGGFPGYGAAFVPGGYRGPDAVDRPLFADNVESGPVAGRVHQVAQGNWSPVRNLTFSGTVNHVNPSAKRLAYDSAVLTDGTVGSKPSTDGVAPPCASSATSDPVSVPADRHPGARAPGPFLLIWPADQLIDSRGKAA